MVRQLQPDLHLEVWVLTCPHAPMLSPIIDASAAVHLEKEAKT